MSKIPAETDIVVIGSGVAGLAAALTAAEKGAGVIVFERQRSLGGTSNFFKGTRLLSNYFSSGVLRCVDLRYFTLSQSSIFENFINSLEAPSYELRNDDLFTPGTEDDFYDSIEF